MRRQRTLSFALVLCLLSLPASTAQTPKDPVALDDLGDPLPEGALRRIGTTRMRGYHQVQFTDDGKLLGLKRSQNAFEEIDPATGKALSRTPLILDGKPFESRQGFDGDSEVSLSSGGRFWIRGERKNGRSPKVQGDYALTVFDRATGARKLLLEGVPSDRARFAFSSPRDHYLVVRGSLFRQEGDPGNPIPFKIYDLEKGTILGELTAPGDDGSGRAERILFSDDEKTLLLVGKRTAVRHTLPDLKETNRFEIGESSPESLSNDGKQLLALDGTWKPKDEKIKPPYRMYDRVVLFDTVSGKRIGNLDGLCPDRVDNAVFDPVRDRIILNGVNEKASKMEMRTIDRKSGKVLQVRASSLGVHPTFSKDGRKLLLFDYYYSNALVIDAESGRDLLPSAIADAPLGEVAGLAHAPDGMLAANATNSGILRFDRAGRRVGEPVEPGSHFIHLAFTDYGGTLMAASRFAFKVIWLDSRTGGTLRTYNLPEAPAKFGDHQIPRASFSGDGKRVVYEGFAFNERERGSELNEISVPDDGKPIRRVIMKRQSPIQTWAFHPGRDWLLERSGLDPKRDGQMGTLFVTELKTSKGVGWFPEMGRLSSLFFNHAGDRAAGLFNGELVTTGDGNTFRNKATGLNVYSMPDGKLLHSFEHNDATAKAAFTRDGRFIILCDKAGFRVCELSSGGIALERKVELGTSVSSDRCFASSLSVAWDGLTFATGHMDGNIYVWDLLQTDGKRLAPPRDDEIAGFLQALRTRNAREAYAAGCRLLTLGDTVIPKLMESLKPDPKLADTVATLLVQLDDAKFAKREAAQAELLRQPEAADVLMRKALAEAKQGDLKDRLTKILAARDKGISTDALQRDRAKLLLERIGTPAAREALKGMR